MLSCCFCSKPAPEDWAPETKPALRACPNCLNPVCLMLAEKKAVIRPLRRGSDIRSLTPDGSIGAPLLKELPAALKDLPVLPEVSMRVLQMVRKPDVSMAQLAAVVSEDAAIAMKVMQLANSPIYGGLNKIKSLDAACARLGMQTVSNAVQAVANQNLFISGDPRLRTYMKQLWRHSVAVGYCAAALAHQLAEPNSESLFVGGLIHDIGKAILLDIVSSRYQGAAAELRDSPELLQEVLENLHVLAGLHAVQALGLPPEFGIFVYCHHRPEISPDPDYLSGLHILSLADGMAKAEGYTPTPTEDILLTSHDSANFLNLSDLQIASLRVDLQDKLESVFEALS